MLHLLAQDDAAAQAGGAALLAGGCFFMIIYLAIIVVIIAGMWKSFAKAGKPGWGAIVPIYNLVLLLEIAGRPLWWILLFLVPGVNFIVMLLVCLDVARKFRQSSAFAIGLWLLAPIFWCILGFGSAQYDASA